MCGDATEKARRANSVRVLAADSSEASEDRNGVGNGVERINKVTPH